MLGDAITSKDPKVVAVFDQERGLTIFCLHVGLRTIFMGARGLYFCEKLSFFPVAASRGRYRIYGHVKATILRYPCPEGKFGPTYFFCTSFNIEKVFYDITLSI